MKTRRPVNSNVGQLSVMTMELPHEIVKTVQERFDRIKAGIVNLTQEETKVAPLGKMDRRSSFGQLTISTQVTSCHTANLDFITSR